jgi:hypothetical protein
MPTYNQLSDFQTNDVPVPSGQISPTTQVEPLDGVTTLADLMDRFPEEVYAQGTDTVLYKFLTALTGDSGAGYVERLAYAARLQGEAQIINFDQLDTIYTGTFKFARLPNEITNFDPDVVLTQDQWNVIQQKDEGFRARMMDFFQACRLGNSPAAMSLAAQSGTGVQCEIIENYRYIFDTISDDPLGIAYNGSTNSVNEFIVNPRLIDLDGNPDASVTYAAPFVQSYSYVSGAVHSTYQNFGGVWAHLTSYATGAIISTSSGYWQATVGGTSGSTAPNWATGSTATDGTVTWNPMAPASATSLQSGFKLLPAIERNMVDLMDRLRPVGAFMSVTIQDQHYKPIAFDDSTVSASSERFYTTRFVTGNAAVNWPEVDNGQGTYIVPGEETEVPKPPLSGRDLPVIFQTIQNIHAYSDKALEDINYDTDLFYSPVITPTPYTRYRSQHTGPFHPIYASIYPFLKQVPTNDQFTPDKAIAIHNTPLILEGKSA